MQAKMLQSLITINTEIEELYTKLRIYLVNSAYTLAQYCVTEMSFHVLICKKP